jgi:hypothetical protein
MANDLITKPLKETTESVKQHGAMERALLAATTVKAPVVGTKKPTTKARRGATSDTSEAEELGDLILQGAQQVRVAFLGTSLEFEACVAVSEDGVSMLITRGVIAWTPPKETQITLSCDSGDFQLAYIGTRITFGLRAVLIGFIILHDD